MMIMAQKQEKREIVTPYPAAWNIKRQQLLENLSLLEREKNSALFEATKNSDLRVIYKIFQLGVDVNAKDEEGKTALMHAVYVNDDIAFRMLLASKVDVNLQDNKGNDRTDARHPCKRPE